MLIYAANRHSFDLEMIKTISIDICLPGMCLQPRNLSHFHQMKDDITRHLRDRNYSNADIQQKLDEYFIDLGGTQNPRRGVRWS